MTSARGLSAALTCLLTGTALAAPKLEILYHERLDITPRAGPSGQQHLSFDAYGRHFDVDLEINDDIARAVPVDRSDIKPYKGTVAGQPGSWVRLTQTRDGWRGVLHDGRDLYAIEPAGDLQKSVAPPLPDNGSSSSPLMYRLADALMPDGVGYCGTDAIGTEANEPSTALKAFSEVSTDLLSKDTARVPTRELVVGVIADHTFADAVGPDVQGAIVSRMDIVDGIWSTQVGIKIALAPPTILTDRTDFFSDTTVPGDLLAEVGEHSARLSAHSVTGLTHLMTARAMQGNIVGISYLGAVCQGANAVSLSQSATSTTIGALIVAHELGHSFNAVHDGVPGVCSTTPQTYLMAPVINFSHQFSACSLNSIEARAQTASCLVQVPPAAGGSQSPSTGSQPSDPPVGNQPDPTGGGGRLDVSWLVLLASLLIWQRVRLPQPAGSGSSL